MRVLAAVDQSDYSRLALEYLGRLPCHASLDLSLLTVVPVIPTYHGVGPDSGFGIDIPELRQSVMEAVQSSLKETAALHRSDFKSVNTTVVYGHPGREIVRLAIDKDSDLIVIGATGHSAIARVLLGSVADFVATHADRSTLVVRPTTESRLGSTTTQPARVLIAIGNAENDDQIASWVEKLELAKETEIHLVHVMEQIQFYELDLLHRASAYWKEARSVAMTHIKSLEERFQSLGYSTVSDLIEAPHIGKALIDYADHHPYDLIITGDQRETLMERIILGSTSRHVLRHADSNVLISRHVP